MFARTAFQENPPRKVTVFHPSHPMQSAMRERLAVFPDDLLNDIEAELAVLEAGFPLSADIEALLDLSDCAERRAA